MNFPQQEKKSNSSQCVDSLRNFIVFQDAIYLPGSRRLRATVKWSCGINYVQHHQHLEDGSKSLIPHIKKFYTSFNWCGCGWRCECGFSGGIDSFNQIFCFNLISMHDWRLPKTNYLPKTPFIFTVDILPERRLSFLLPPNQHMANTDTPLSLA